MVEVDGVDGRIIGYDGDVTWLLPESDADAKYILLGKPIVHWIPDFSPAAFEQRLIPYLEQRAHRIDMPAAQRLGEAAKTLRMCATYAREDLSAAPATAGTGGGGVGSSSSAAEYSLFGLPVGALAANASGVGGRHAANRVTPLPSAHCKYAHLPALVVKRSAAGSASRVATTSEHFGCRYRLHFFAAATTSSTFEWSSLV